MQTYGFILLPGFALMSFAAATEPLRAANILAGKELYRVEAFSVAGGMVESSSGVCVPTEKLAKAGKGLHTIFVCAGGGPADWKSPEIAAALRRLTREGVRIGGISGGPYLLAEAGVLANRRFTIHWEHAPALMEAFPDLVPERARYVIDGNCITCGGGIAPLDMMSAVIAERLGADFARRVSDWYLHTHIEEASGAQRASRAETYGTHHPRLLTLLEKMETTLEQPMDRAAMAAFAGITPRHLDRLFAGEMGTTFQAVYRRMRLEHARRLLRQSAMSVAEVAMATGFASASHFSRVYRAEMGVTPRADRQPTRG